MYQRFCIGLFSILVFLSDLHGANHATVPAMEVFEGRIVSLSPSTQTWIQLWGDGWGEVRAHLMEPASPRLQGIYRTVLKEVALRGFSIHEPALYQTNALARVHIVNPPMRYYGRYFAGPNYILVDTVWVDEMEDMDVRVLVAHEVGHGIDVQTERIGHAAFHDVYHLGKQEFADYIASLIVSKDAVAAFKNRYVLVTTTERLLQ